MQQDERGQRASPAAWYALGVLAMISFFAFLDRQILVLLAEHIRRDLQLTDLQLGLIQGFGVALFAALAGFPLGWAADRFDRRVVLSLCIAFWSAAVVACAFSQTFLQLFLAGAMVGAGEAGLAPIMYALIPLYFFGRQRQIANSVSAMATVGGGALAFSVAGQIVVLSTQTGTMLPAPLAGLADWRISLLMAAALAPLMILLALSIRLPRNDPPPPPPRGQRPTSADQADAVWAYLSRHRSTYLRFYVGGAMGSFAFAALAVWLAVVAARSFNQTPAQIGAALGGAQIGSALFGFLLSITVTRLFGARWGAALPVRMLWMGMTAAALVLLTLPWAGSAFQLYFTYAAAGIFLTFCAMAFPTALQNISPERLRGRIASIQFITVMLIASTAPPLVGALSDRLAPLPGAVLLAMTIVAVPALLVGTVLIRSCEGPRLQAVMSASEARNPRSDAFGQD